MISFPIPTIVHWQLERDIALKAPLLLAAYRNTILVPPHILFPALESILDDKGKRDFLLSIVDGHYEMHINQPNRLN